MCDGGGISKPIEASPCLFSFFFPFRPLLQIARAPDAPQNVDKEQLRSRQEARAFLLWVLATDKEATQTVVEAITQRALRLSPHAIVIVAGVVGAPSPEEFMEALARLTPAGLQKLRDDLSEMGINNQ